MPAFSPHFGIMMTRDTSEYFFQIHGSNSRVVRKHGQEHRRQSQRSILDSFYSRESSIEFDEARKKKE